MSELAQVQAQGDSVLPITLTSRAWTLLQALRPKQWAKNTLVAAAPLAAGELSKGAIVVRALTLFLALCCASSAGYLVNDVRDRAYDRLHPRKRLRPIASGRVTVSTALVTAAVLAVASVVLSASCGRVAALLTLTYLALTLAYSMWLKSVPGLEMVIVSAGFLLRAVIGGAGTSTVLSGWFLIVICAAALLVVAGKRVAEMHRLGAETPHTGGAKRSAIRAYSRGYLRLVCVMAATVAVVAYAAWVVLVGMHRGPAVFTAASAAPVTAAVARYVHVINNGGGESPEDALLDDWAMRVFGVLWLVTFAVYVSSMN